MSNSEDKFSYDESRLDNEPVTKVSSKQNSVKSITEESKNLVIKSEFINETKPETQTINKTTENTKLTENTAGNIPDSNIIQFKPQHFKINETLEIQRPFTNPFATLSADVSVGLYSIKHPIYNAGRDTEISVLVKEKFLLTKPLELQVGQAILWKCGEDSFRRARVEEVHKNSIPLRVDILLIDIGRKIFFMKTEMLIKVENDWFVSDKLNSADDSVLAKTKYVDLPAKAIMIDHESIENLPVDLDDENETKYKVEVVSINHVNGWPIYNLEPLEKYVNGELVPVIIPEESAVTTAPAKKKIKTEHTVSKQKTKVETQKMTAEEKQAAKARKQEEREMKKHEKAINELMKSMLINLGNSIASPECSVFLEWLSDKTGDHVVLEERVKPDVLPGYKHQARFKISKELFMTVLGVEDNIREYILQKKQTESWDSIHLGEKTGNFKKMFVNFDEAGDARIVFRNFYFNTVNQEFMKTGISQRIALSESQFSMLIEAKADIIAKFREAEIDRQVEDHNRSKFFSPI